MATDNRQALIDAMDCYDLDIAAVVRLTGNSPTTVTSWLRPTTNKAYRNIPDQTLELLKLKLSAHTYKGTKP